MVIVWFQGIPLCGDFHPVFALFGFSIVDSFLLQLAILVSYRVDELILCWLKESNNHTFGEPCAC